MTTGTCTRHAGRYMPSLWFISALTWKQPQSYSHPPGEVLDRSATAEYPTGKVKTDMRAVVQRVASCSVSVSGHRVSSIGRGLLVLLGIAAGDREPDADYLADKITHLRIFEDSAGKMNLSLRDLDLEILVVSQFTLLGDCRRGRRPSFTDAAPPDRALRLYEYFVESIKRHGIVVATGQFRAMMQVELINDGPVTLILESRPLK
jgi:D-tyrosyl-tRNA(Tyr) deacylase